MTYTGIYGLLLVLHLLTVAFVVGPAAVAGVTSARHARAGRAEALRDASRVTRTYTLATLATVLLGAALVGLGGVGEQWSYGQAWISTSFALSILAVGLVVAIVVPAQVRAAEEIEAGRDPGRPVTRISAGAGLALLAWTAVVVLMVFKPGT